MKYISFDFEILSVRFKGIGSSGSSTRYACGKGS